MASLSRAQARDQGEGEEGNLLREFCFVLLIGTTSGPGDADVGSAVENVLAVYGALAKHRPSFCVVVVHVGRIGRRSRDVELDGSKVREDLANASYPVFVD